MDTNSHTIGFLQARLLQGFLVAIAAIIILPSCWSFFFLAFGGWFKTLGFSLSIAFFRPYQIYLPSFITACVIAVVIGMRSVGWGSISLRYTVIATTLVSIIFDIVLRGIKFVWPQQVANLGIENENFFYWTSAWLAAGLLFWLILNLSGLTKRYKISERARLNDAAKFAFVFAIYGPILYSIITLWILVGDNLVFLAVRGPLSGKINTAGLMLTSLTIFCGVRKLRFDGSLSWLWLFRVSLIIALCFWITDSLFVTKADWQKNGLHLLVVYVLTAISTSSIAGGLLFFMGVPFNGKRFSSIIRPSLQFYHGRAACFALVVFLVFFIVAPPVWQCGTLLWRALLFSFPPPSFFVSNFSLAYIHAGVIFGGFSALLAYYKKHLDINLIFLAGVLSTACSFFLPMSYLGVSFGLFYDFFSWPMLLFLPTIMFSCYVLSCCKQVRLS